MVLGKSETHQVLYASLHLLPVGVCTQVGPWGDYVTNCHDLTILYEIVLYMMLKTSKRLYVKFVMFYVTKLFYT